ncbi:MAG: ribulose-phosphate 3-epimerase [Alphaproteobacteria bacterium]|nr:ribulose-phosphate 3-epimerase [Alphaproteobacteria bacterium]
MPKNGRHVRIAPSLLAADLLNLQKEIEMLTSAGADWIHLDIMDGHFVPNLSFGPDFVHHIRAVSSLPIDVHLMIAPTDAFIDQFAIAGASCLTIHPEAGYHTHRSLQKIKDHGIKAGLALNPGTPIQVAVSLLDMLDLVLIMTVNPGFGGQKFITSPLEKLKELRALIDAKNLPILIEVDGGINDQTAPDVLKAGADVLVVGNYIFSKDHPVSVQVYRSRIESLGKK